MRKRNALVSLKAHRTVLAEKKRLQQLRKKKKALAHKTIDFAFALDNLLRKSGRY